MPIGRMRTTMTMLSVSLMALTVAMLFWLGRNPQGLSASDPALNPHAADPVSDGTLFLGLIPERDVFAQRRRYRALTEYLSLNLGRPVTLVTSNTYHGALNDMARGRIDAAFMGSMVATLALDELRARVLVKPQTADGVTTYRGVIFVRNDSPIQSLDDLAGRSIAMLRTTTAGHLFPVYALSQQGLIDGADPPVFRWVGTHDRVIQDVYDGLVDAGAAKDLRIDAFERSHDGYLFHRLAVSEAVPDNALIVSRDLDAELVGRLERVLLTMNEHDDGRRALSLFGAQRFVPCSAEEYRAVHDMADHLGPGWGLIGTPETEQRDADGYPMDTDAGDPPKTETIPRGP